MISARVANSLQTRQIVFGPKILRARTKLIFKKKAPRMLKNTKGYQNQNRKFWGLSKLAILVHQQFGARLGVSEMWAGSFASQRCRALRPGGPLPGRLIGNKSCWGVPGYAIIGKVSRVRTEGGKKDFSESLWAKISK